MMLPPANYTFRPSPTQQHDKVLGGRITKGNQDDKLPSPQVSGANTPAPSANLISIWTDTAEMRKMLLMLKKSMILDPDSFRNGLVWRGIWKAFDDSSKTPEAFEIKMGDLLTSFAELRTMRRALAIPWNNQTHMMTTCQKTLPAWEYCSIWRPEVLKWQTTPFPFYDMFEGHGYDPIITEGGYVLLGDIRWGAPFRIATSASARKDALIKTATATTQPTATQPTAQPTGLDAFTSTLIGQAIMKVQGEKSCLNKLGMVFLMGEFTERTAGVYLSIEDDQLRVEWLKSRFSDMKEPDLFLV